MIVTCRARRAADGMTVAAEVSSVLERRGALKHPPVTLAVSDPVALGIAGIFASPSQTGQVFERFIRTGSADDRELLAAAEFEQGYASAEGHAALYCLIGWVRAQTHKASAE